MRFPAMDPSQAAAPPATDQFTAYMKGIREEQQKGDAEVAVFPVELAVVPNCVFRARDPIVLGVEVQVGSLGQARPRGVSWLGVIHVFSHQAWKKMCKPLSGPGVSALESPAWSKSNDFVTQQNYQKPSTNRVFL